MLIFSLHGALSGFLYTTRNEARSNRIENESALSDARHGIKNLHIVVFHVELNICILLLTKVILPSVHDNMKSPIVRQLKNF